ncbi:MAG: hypothetical protein ACXW27_07940 [Allosphingosinicella sp.]
MTIGLLPAAGGVLPSSLFCARPSRVPAFTAFLTAICVFLWASAADAQGAQAPPAIAIVGPGGVNFGNGTFHLEEAPDLSIGGDGLEEGLHLTREYQSGLPGVFSSGMKSQGWTHNLMVSITRRRATTHRTWAAGKEPYLYSLSVGGRSAMFLGGSSNPTGGWVGSYSPVLQDLGTSLVYTGTEQSGAFTFTDRDGSVITITDLRVRQWIFPSGVVLTYHYNSGDVLTSVFSSRGYALIFEGDTRWTRACAVNLARTHVAPGSSCPTGVASVGYAYDAGMRLSAVTDVTGAITQYEYNPAGNASRMNCVRRPGQSSCRIINQYASCQRDPVLTQDPPDLRLMDRVTHQQTSTGETYYYEYSSAPYCPSLTDTPKTTMSASGAGTTEVVTNDSGAPLSVKDPLGRTTISEYPITTYYVQPTLPSRIQLPEGNQYYIGYTRGSVSSVRAVTKPGTGAADLTATTLYETACINVRTCNRPKSTTDANGNTTDFTYDPTHGGVLTETGPAVNGVKPQTRHRYQPRSAWIGNGAGGYQASTTPIWVRTATSLCRASAASGNASAPCAGGDELLTTYDYGPDGGPNNLLPRGTIVGAGGQSLRTCFGYDALGNRISETEPRAGLTSCP